VRLAPTRFGFFFFFRGLLLLLVSRLESLRYGAHAFLSLGQLYFDLSSDFVAVGNPWPDLSDDSDGAAAGIDLSVGGIVSLSDCSSLLCIKQGTPALDGRLSEFLCGG